MRLACRLTREASRKGAKSQRNHSKRFNLASWRLCGRLLKVCPTLDLKLLCDGESQLETPANFDIYSSDPRVRFSCRCPKRCAFDLAGAVQGWRKTDLQH